MSFPEARDSSSQMTGKAIRENHLEKFSFNSFVGNEENLSRVSRSRTWPGCMFALSCVFRSQGWLSYFR